MPRSNQLFDELLAHAFDVHRAPADEMLERLLALGAAVEASRAARRRLAFEPHDRRLAYRAFLRHHETVFPAPRPLGWTRTTSGITSPARRTHDRVARPHVLAPQVVLVVQRGIGHRDAADLHRLQARHRRQHASAADLDLDLQHFRGLLLCRVLVRDREPRRPRDESQLLLPVQPVHLVDHTVDGVRQLFALLSRFPCRNSSILPSAWRRAVPA
jgi:hypothetical protein